MFLDDDELATLTGYQRPHKQAEWFRAHGYAFELDAHGRPRVLRSAVEQRLGARVESRREPKLRLP